MNRLLATLLTATAFGAQAQGTVYRCPGPPVLYTDALSAKEAIEKGCRTIEGTPITVLQAPRPRAATAAAAAAAPSAESRGADTRIDAGQQRVRDDERRRVLQAELRQAEERLAALQREYNGGQGERRGDERNYQKYLDRMAELKDSVARTEADVQALKREISKLP
jgi:chromosome segregation ATPase